MKKTIGIVIFFLAANTIESLDNNKDKKSNIKIVDPKNHNNTNQPANNRGDEGCFFCCSKTDCMKEFK